MPYTAMKKLIQNENNKFENGSVSQEEYVLWKENQQNKLDLFLIMNRLTLSQTQELSEMFLAFE